MSRRRRDRGPLITPHGWAVLLPWSLVVLGLVGLAACLGPTVREILP